MGIVGLLLSLFVFSFVLFVYWVFSILPIVTNIISNLSLIHI